MYLLDTNIILELLLDQEQADRVAQFLNQAAPASLHLSEFSLYSLGVILIRLKRHEAFIQAVEDLLLSGIVGLLRLEVQDMPKVAETAQTFALDFDDAYQYVTAEKYDLALLSFDNDFDRTARGRKTLEELMKVK
jgi:predicted nucleic acid-binding protein